MKISANVLFLWIVFLVFSTPAIAAPIFTTQFGSPQTDIGYKVAADIDGNIYVAGDTQGKIDGKTFNGVQDGFLRKMDSTGKLLWTLTIGTAAYDEIRGLALDSSGNAYVCGTTAGNFVSGFGGYDFFVAKVSPSGTLLWLDQSGTSLEDYAQSVVVDSTGNAYVCGWTMGQLSTTDNRNPKIYRDAFITKYSPTGSRLWTHQFNTASRPLNNTSFGLALYNDKLYISGLTCASASGNLFLVVYDVNGNFLWKQSIGGENTTGKAVAVDSTGIYVGGFTLTVFDGNSYLGGYRNSIIIKYDLNGNKMWSRICGAGYWDEINGIVIDSNSNVFVSGTTNGNLDMQPKLGGMDVFITKFSSTGTKIYTSLLGTFSSDYGYAIGLDAVDNILVTGSTYYAFPGQYRVGGYDAFVSVYPSETDAAVATITVLNKSNSTPISGVFESVLDPTSTTQQMYSDTVGQVKVKMKKAGQMTLSKSKDGYAAVTNPESFVINKGVKNFITTYMNAVSSGPSWTLRKTTSSTGNPATFTTVPVTCTAYWLIAQAAAQGAYVSIGYYTPATDGTAGGAYSGGTYYECGGNPYYDMNTKKNTVFKAGTVYMFHSSKDITISTWTNCMTYDPKKK